MFGFLTGLFGGTKNAETVVDTAAKGIYNGIDKIVYTEEEKAEARAKGVEYYLQFMKMVGEENSVRSVTRRIIAWSIVAVVELTFLVSFGFVVTGHPEVVASIIELVNAFQLGWAFVAIIVFYFGVQFFRTQSK